MGLLVDGVWKDRWYDTASSNGRYIREDAQFRQVIGEDERYPAESGRYHLYVSLACPWAHRTLIMRQLKDLDSHISVSVVSSLMLEQGWTFDKQHGSTGDTLLNNEFLSQIYTLAQPAYSGRVTVPVLFDKETQSIVNNESSEIIRMLNTAFNGITGNTEDYYPETLQEQIDTWNARIYPAINNGVYRAGFATTQDAYEEAYTELFAELDHLDKHLSEHRYLCGSQFTEADIRFFTTLIRFDAVYHGHFKCNRQKIEDFAVLPDYLRDVFQISGVADTVNFKHIKDHYYASHRTINPSGVVPLGPDIDFRTSHTRELLNK